jgi:DNA-binding NtrC family response regulator
MPANILIVDDEPDLLEILRFTLEGEGYRTFAASTVQGALDRLKQTPIDLVLTDVRLPEGDGLEILAAGKRANPGLSVILMTGFADVDLADATERGAAALLSKPFDHTRLVQLVREQLGSRPR